jgi:hypothetical protein
VPNLDFLQWSSNFGLPPHGLQNLTGWGPIFSFDVRNTFVPDFARAEMRVYGSYVSQVSVAFIYLFIYSFVHLFIHSLFSHLFIPCETKEKSNLKFEFENSFIGLPRTACLR